MSNFGSIHCEHRQKCLAQDDGILGVRFRADETICPGCPNAIPPRDADATFQVLPCSGCGAPAVAPKDAMGQLAAIQDELGGV